MTRSRKSWQPGQATTALALAPYAEWGVRCASETDFVIWYATALDAALIGASGPPSRGMFCGDADGRECASAQARGLCLLVTARAEKERLL